MNSRSIFAILLVTAAAMTVSAQNAVSFGSRPLAFEAGETSGLFKARGSDSEFSFTADHARISLRGMDGRTGDVLMEFLGTSSGKSISGLDLQPGKINYLVGDVSEWRTGVPVFAKLAVQEMYPGINLVYYGNQQKLEYDFNVAPGAKPENIAISYQGAEKISLNARHELVIQLKAGEIIQPAPVAYQWIKGERHFISAAYKISSSRQVAFDLGDYHRDLPLIIDPVLSYSTFFGGNFGDSIHAIKVDAGGSVYIAGETLSTVFSNGIPVGSLTNKFQGGAIKGDAFVAKFDNTGTNLVYFTYLGGNADEVALGLDIDAAGNAYVTGYTDSTNFPARNALQTKLSGKLFHGVFPVDAFVAELNPAGSGLVYSTFLGGNAADIGSAIAVDTDGTANIAGYTYSTNFPVTPGAFQSRLATTNSQFINANAFVAAIAPGGTALNYSSYFGGTNFDQATAIALDASHAIYVAGFTASTNFPLLNALPGFQLLNSLTNATGAYDAFVAKFQPGFGGLVYSTFLGSTNNDFANGIAADASGNAFVVGGTTSRTFPNTITNIAGLNSFLRTNVNFFSVTTNAFLTKIQFNGNNAVIASSIVFGGRGADVANAVALGASGNIFVTGSASSTNFPVTPGNLIGSLRATNGGGNDVFVTAFQSDFSALLYSTYLGGKADDLSYAIAVDSADSAYVAGQTLSTNFPVFSARQAVRSGTNDAFLAKIILSAAPSLSVRMTAGKFIVSWPPVGEATTNVWGVETSLEYPGTNWSETAQLPVFTNGQYIYEFNRTNNARFFRLEKY